MIPTPKFAVFYNGNESMPEKTEMRLSESFEKKNDNPELELRCTVYNINTGANRTLLERCRILKEYMVFVDYVRYYSEIKLFELADAVNEAIDRCIAEGIIKDFLREHRDEVVKVTMLDYTFEHRLEMGMHDALEQGRDEGRKEGRKEGRDEGRKEGEFFIFVELVCKKIKKNKSIEQISDELECGEEEIRTIFEAAKLCAPDYAPREVIKKFI